ncbi:MAG TPA: HAD family hydrolase [Candidatus Levybacteria bacterium]|nr:HAD family hydrolase [Candidatus Levybacteria bacterium]
MNSMQYKALFLDVDGTLVPYEYNALPSQKVAEAIQQAQKHVAVCLVTGRSYAFVKHILQTLQINTGYAVVNTGALIIDLANESIVREQYIEQSDVSEIFRVLSEEAVKLYVKDTPFDPTHYPKFYDTSNLPEKAYMIFTDEEYPEEKIDLILQKLSHLSNLNVHKTVHKDPSKFGINVTHLNATKLHGVQFLLERLKLNREEVIGVGDSYNDFPLLMASGLKVAMGNAIQELKDIADYVAPPVTQDGVADVIEKYILSHT